jgi:membrane-bound lytic murein transglycosylase C
MALSAIPSAVASQAQLFEELSEKMSRWQTSEPSDEELSEFEQYKRQQLSEFADYVEEHFEEYDAFRDNVIQQWGDITVADQAAFVTYSDDLSSRMVVDFEANELVVSIRHAEDEKVSQAQLQALYKEFTAKDRAVIDVFNVDTLAINQSETTKREVDNAARAKALIAAKKQIDSQFEQQQRYIERQTDEAIIDGEDSKLAEAQQQAQQKKLELLKQKRLKKLLETASNTGKSEATVVSEIVLKLPKQTELSKHRAERYVSQVNAQAKRFDIEPSLIFAVMHTESHFNPMAKSHIPAFGLMQIVPTSAGVDVNRMLYNRDEPMSAPYLYVTDNNIEAGTAYLNILDKRYLSKIHNPLSRKYCTLFLLAF